MKRRNTLFGMLSSVLMIGTLASCSNDLNESGLNGGLGNGQLRAVVAPDAVVWSGNQTIGNSFTGENYATRAATVAADDFEYDYFTDEQDTQLGYAANPETVSDYKDAVLYTGAKSEYGQVEQGSGTYYVPKGEYKITEGQYGGQNPGVIFDNNSTVIVFLQPGAKVENIGSNLTKVTVYVAPGAELTITDAGSGDWYIYNGGKLNVPNGLKSSKIKEIYNTGDIILGSGGSGTEESIKLYSKGGVVYVEQPADGSTFDLKNTMIIDYLLYVEGNLKIESSGKRDICIIKATGDIEMTDSNNGEHNYVGEILGKNISFDGIRLKLHPNGKIEAENKITIGNSGCSIDAYDEGYEGVVRCQEFVLSNNHLTEVIGKGIYFDVDKLTSTKDGNTPASELLGAEWVGSHKAFTPACSYNGDSDLVDSDKPNNPNPNPNPNPTCPNKDPNDSSKGCDHPHSGPYCEDCDQNHGNCAHPCPNHKCDHPEYEHNDDGTCNECDPNVGCNACPNDKCDHPKSDHNPDGTCQKCPEDEDCNAPGNNGNTSNPNNGKYANNEVEINLSLNDIHTISAAKAKYDVADLVSKLSIHVRYPHDVEVILPVPEALYCNQDDLYIINSHYVDGAYGSDPDHGDHQFNGEQHVLSYPVAGKDVKLIITYVSGQEDKLTRPNSYFKDGIKLGGYISVKTEGIDEDVINYCRENFGDGINFEIYNYYNRGNNYKTGKYSEISFKDLQYYFLSRSFVNFDWETSTIESKNYPDFYINAFNKTREGNPVYNDCYVWIWGDNHAIKNSCPGTYDFPDAQLQNGTKLTFNSYLSPDVPTVEKNYFYNPYQGEHFNGSPFNWIYTNKKVNGGVDSDDMLNEKTGWWPFAKGESISGHYYRIKENENFWYYQFDETGNFLAPGNPFTKLTE